jgi:tetratricopeptide (TPR) repeat protein
MHSNYRLPLTILLVLLLSSAPLCFAQEPPDYVRAEAFVKQSQWDAGIEILQHILKAEPRNLKALNLLGIALTGKGDLVGANREFQRALRIQPRFYPALQNLAINELTLKDAAAAERHFNAALQLAPHDSVVHAYLGEIAYSRQDYENAATHLSQAGPLLQQPGTTAHLVRSYLETEKAKAALELLRKLDKNALGTKAQFGFGLALAQHELFAEAIPYFELVRQSFPDSYDAGFNLANCYVQAKQFPKAIEVLRALKEGGHKTAELDNLLGEAYEGNQQVDEAIEALREATLIAPEDENNYIDLSALCIDHEAFDLGLEVLNVGLHYRPQSDRLVFQRGLLYAMQGHFDLADQDFQLASKLAPEKNLSYVGLGVSYMQTGNLPEAVRILRERTKEKPNDSTLQYLLGEALMRSGVSPGDPQFAEAKSAFEQSARLSQTFAPSRVELAKLYLRENRVDEAVALLEKARSLDPKDKAAYSQLAIAYRRQGKPELAAAMLSTLARLNDEDRVKESRGRVRLVKEDSSVKDQNP